MQTEQLRGIVEDAWEARDSISPKTEGAVRDAVTAALAGLDTGDYRVAEKGPEGWQVHQWLKKAVLLSFRLNDMAPIPGGPGESTYWWDKVPSKFEGWGENRFREAGFRAVPNCIVRHSAYIAPGVIRSAEHTSELQSLMRISYAVFCLKKKKKTTSKITI